MDTTIGKILFKIAEKRGILYDDLRIKDEIRAIRSIEKKTGTIISEEEFRKIVEHSFQFINKIMSNKMVIKDLKGMKDRVQKIINEVKDLPNEGKLPNSIP